MNGGLSTASLQPPLKSWDAMSGSSTGGAGVVNGGKGVGPTIGLGLLGTLMSDADALRSGSDETPIWR